MFDNATLQRIAEFDGDRNARLLAQILLETRGAERVREEKHEVIKLLEVRLGASDTIIPLAKFEIWKILAILKAET